MVASSQHTLVTNAATYGSAQSAKREAESTGSSAPTDQENPQASGATHSLVDQHDGNLPCFGAWVADAQCQDTDSNPDDVHSDRATRAACARHCNIQEALLESTSNGRVIELLQKSDIDSVVKRLVGREGGKSPSPACTCEVIIEVDDEETSSLVPTEDGEKSAG